MDIFHSIILGVVQGVTEFLPISSTGHLILAEKLLALGQGEFLKSFDIIIQLGSILAVMVLYWRQFLNWEILKRLAVAFVPTGILGLALYKIVKTYLLGNEAVVLWSLLIGGILLVVFEYWHKEKNLPQPLLKEGSCSLPLGRVGEDLNFSYRHCFYIGLFQSIAMIPGVSRSAATILGGLLLGLKRRTIVEFSFLLAAPTMLAATGLDLFKSAGQFSVAQWDFLATGFIAAFLVAIAAIRFFLGFIKKHTFIPFGVYRIVIAVLFYIYIIN